MRKTYDFNTLELAASKHIGAGDYKAALAIYLYMAIGDASLSGGYYGRQIAFCYQMQGQLHAAQYWYLRAIEENPELNADCWNIIASLGDVGIDQYL